MSNAKEIFLSALHERLKIGGGPHYQKPLHFAPDWTDVSTATSTTQSYSVGFEVLTAVVMTSPTFWDMTTCSPLKLDRCFGGTSSLHLQGLKVKPA
jgi:hypothetical protein